MLMAGAWWIVGEASAGTATISATYATLLYAGFLFPRTTRRYQKVMAPASVRYQTFAQRKAPGSLRTRGSLQIVASTCRSSVWAAGLGGWGRRPNGGLLRNNATALPRSSTRRHIDCATSCRREVKDPGGGPIGGEVRPTSSYVVMGGKLRHSANEGPRPEGATAGVP